MSDRQTSMLQESPRVRRRRPRARVVRIETAVTLDFSLGPVFVAWLRALPGVALAGGLFTIAGIANDAGWWFYVALGLFGTAFAFVWALGRVRPTRVSVAGDEATIYTWRESSPSSWRQGARLALGRRGSRGVHHRLAWRSYRGHESGEGDADTVVEFRESLELRSR